MNATINTPNTPETINENINVSVSISRGEIISNFEEIKKRVKAIADSYKVTVYTGTREDRQKQLKADRAKLRKLSEKLDEQRKKVKKEFSAPLNAFEDQVKDLISLIEEPTTLIDTREKEIAAEIREEKDQQIRAYYDEIIADEPEFSDPEFAEWFFAQIYVNSWANVSTSAKTYKTAISGRVDELVKSVATIKSLNSEFEEIGLKLVRSLRPLTEAIQTVKSEEAKRDAIIERERKAAEEAERKEKEAEEAKKRAAEEKARRAEAEAKAAAMAAENARLAKEKEEADAKAKAAAGATTSRSNTVVMAQTAAAGTVLVSFSEFDWNLLKQYCDDNFIGYTVQH